MEIHSWCCAWLCKFTPTWCWPRVFTRLQRVLVLNENVWISIKISLKFVPEGSVNNTPSLVQIIAWRQSGDKPESMMALFTDAYMRPSESMVLRPEYSRRTRLAWLLLMPWLLASPWHQQPYYWPHRISGPLSSMRYQVISTHDIDHVE